jgi:hypothetical protein
MDQSSFDVGSGPTIRHPPRKSNAEISVHEWGALAFAQTRRAIMRRFAAFTSICKDAPSPKLPADHNGKQTGRRERIELVAFDGHLLRSLRRSTH